jgi:hypothetical protein
MHQLFNIKRIAHPTQNLQRSTLILLNKKNNNPQQNLRKKYAQTIPADAKQKTAHTPISQ